MDRPLLVVITPVRNEAWVLEAFLTHCSSWADHIIVADQHSTDGSREICFRFPKVRLIDNPCAEWIEYEVRANLLAEAQSIAGDKIIFALDADEFLSDGFTKTAGWQRILQSSDNEIFCFRWMNFYGDMNHGEVAGAGAEWACHLKSEINVEQEYRVRERNAVHCQRVPCLEEDRVRYVMIEDIRFAHLGGLNRLRNRNKLDFYQVVNIDKNPKHAHPVPLYRAYTEVLEHTAPRLSDSGKISTMQGEDLSPLVRTSDHGQHYVDEMVAIFQRGGYNKFKWLCIWDNPDLRLAGVQFRPPLRVRLVHRYLKCTQRFRRVFFIRFVDKVLKRLIA